MKRSARAGGAAQSAPLLLLLLVGMVVLLMSLLAISVCGADVHGVRNEAADQLRSPLSVTSTALMARYSFDFERSLLIVHHDGVVQCVRKCRDLVEREPDPEGERWGGASPPAQACTAWNFSTGNSVTYSSSSSSSIRGGGALADGDDGVSTNLHCDLLQQPPLVDAAGRLYLRVPRECANPLHPDVSLNYSAPTSTVPNPAEAPSSSTGALATDRFIMLEDLASFLRRQYVVINDTEIFAGSSVTSWTVDPETGKPLSEGSAGNEALRVGLFPWYEILRFDTWLRARHDLYQWNFTTATFYVRPRHQQRTKGGSSQRDGFRGRTSHQRREAATRERHVSDGGDWDWSSVDELVALWAAIRQREDQKAVAVHDAMAVFAVLKHDIVPLEDALAWWRRYGGEVDGATTSLLVLAETEGARHQHPPEKSPSVDSGVLDSHDALGLRAVQRPFSLDWRAAQLHGSGAALADAVVDRETSPPPTLLEGCDAPAATNAVFAPDAAGFTVSHRVADDGTAAPRHTHDHTPVPPPHQQQRHQPNVVQKTKENPVRDGYRGRSIKSMSASSTAGSGGVAWTVQVYWSRYSLFLFGHIVALILASFFALFGILPRRKVFAAFDEVDALSQQQQQRVASASSNSPALVSGAFLGAPSMPSSTMLPPSSVYGGSVAHGGVASTEMTPVLLPRSTMEGSAGLLAVSPLEMTAASSSAAGASRSAPGLPPLDPASFLLIPPDGHQESMDARQHSNVSVESSSSSNINMSFGAPPPLCAAAANIGPVGTPLVGRVKAVATHASPPTHQRSASYSAPLATVHGNAIHISIGGGTEGASVPSVSSAGEAGVALMYTPMGAPAILSARHLAAVSGSPRPRGPDASTSSEDRPNSSFQDAATETDVSGIEGVQLHSTTTTPGKSTARRSEKGEVSDDFATPDKAAPASLLQDPLSPANLVPMSPIASHPHIEPHNRNLQRALSVASERTATSATTDDDEEDNWWRRGLVAGGAPRRNDESADAIRGAQNTLRPSGDSTSVNDESARSETGGSPTTTTDPSSPNVESSVGYQMGSDGTQAAEDRVAPAASAQATAANHSAKPSHDTSARPSASIAAPQLFQQHFRIVRRIGVGGGGVVFLVQHRVTMAEYAIKVVALHEDDDDRSVREAVLHSSFDCPNVVRFYYCWIEEMSMETATQLGIFDRDENGDTLSDLSVRTGGNESLTGGSGGELSTSTVATATYRLLFLQMEYLRNGTLADWLRRRQQCIAAAAQGKRGAVSPTSPCAPAIPRALREIDRVEACEYLLQICKGIEYLHLQGICHRDIKPSNVFLTEKRHVLKIGDFGLACRARTAKKVAADEGLADGGFGEEETLAGCSPLYCSPEQREGKRVTPTSDVFSVGVLAVELFHIFTTAHERISTLEALRQTGEPPAELLDAFPEEMGLVKLLLALNPAQRPSMQAVVTKLKSIIKLLKDRRRLGLAAGSNSNGLSIQPAASLSTPLTPPMSPDRKPRDLVPPSPMSAELFHTGRSVGSIASEQLSRTDSHRTISAASTETVDDSV